MIVKYILQNAIYILHFSIYTLKTVVNSPHQFTMTNELLIF